MKNWNINRVITPVNTAYGAPMGRNNKGTRPTEPTAKIYSKTVNLIDGYDKGGAYWGIGSTLKVDFTPCLTYVEFYIES